RREPAALGDALACLLELVAVHVFLELTAQAAFAGSAEVGVVSPLELVHVLLALGAGLQLELMFDLVALLFFAIDIPGMSGFGGLFFLLLQLGFELRPLIAPQLFQRALVLVL